MARGGITIEPVWPGLVVIGVSSENERAKPSAMESIVITAEQAWRLGNSIRKLIDRDLDGFWASEPFAYGGVETEDRDCENAIAVMPTGAEVERIRKAAVGAPVEFPDLRSLMTTRMSLPETPEYPGGHEVSVTHTVAGADRFASRLAEAGQSAAWIASESGHPQTWEEAVDVASRPEAVEPDC